jgi:hypothetical protein
MHNKLGFRINTRSQAMIDASQIKPHTPVVCSNNGQFATVDHMEGQDIIKLSKDHSGQHHYIPLSWVTSVDDKVHIDRPGPQAMKEWTTDKNSMGMH